ncbi:MAG: hypothetical protein K2Y35_22440 [Burkholderiales bacterium]|nr:hypothetical protein [Burkholderiales bacterium]
MDWTEIVGAVGIGAIATKLLDIVWLQRAVRRSERINWLRDKRIEAFSSLVEELLLTGVWLYSTDPSQARRLCAKALLLVNDGRINDMILGYVPRSLDARSRLDQFINNGSSTIDERTAMREREDAMIRRYANSLIHELRALLLKD